MIDGCTDGWVGTGIPVCVLASGGAQQENSSARAPRDGMMMMKERDYISLGLANQEQGPYSQNAAVVQPSQDKVECDNVELSLGLGLPDKASQQASHVEQLTSTGSQPDHVELPAKLKLASPGAKPQHFWHHTFRVNLSNNDHHKHGNLQAEASNGASVVKSYTANVPAWGNTPGRFTVPVPKVNTVPAKRPYMEVVGERRLLQSGISNHGAATEVPLPCAMPVSTGTYAWNVEPSAGSASMSGGWQQAHVSIDQASNLPSGGGVSSPFVHSRQLAVLPPPPHFKVPQAGVSAPQPPTLHASIAPNGACSSSHVAELIKPEMENESRSKAPMVGWPPVRSFRKNTLQAAQSNRMSSEDEQTKSLGGPSNSGTDGTDHMNGGNSKNAFFVKAKLDGVRICRKVDLKAYDSYDRLKSALQEMFQGFVSDNVKLDLLHGNNYVVTHEDKDGDCLLVGDVPWPMFVESSVKSLRIMKSMDATSIGDKAAVKLKAQGNGNP